MSLYYLARCSANMSAPAIPLKRNPDKSRHDILAAAEDMFAEYGPDGVSLAAIANRAGVSRGLPSYFFSDKETLYRTVIDAAAGDLKGAILEVMQSEEDSPPAEILLKLIDCYMDYLAARPSVVRLLQWNTLENGIQHKAAWASGVPRSLLEETIELFSKRIGADVVGEVDVRDLFISMVSMCLFPFQMGLATQDEVLRRKRHIGLFVLRAIGGH